MSHRDMEARLVAANEALSILEFSVKIGRVHAAKSPQMLVSVFDNLERRCAYLRHALSTNPSEKQVQLDAFS